MSRINLLLFVVLTIACDCSLAHAEDASSAYMIGADISWVQQQEVEGKKWFDDGEQKDILAILKDHGFNWQFSTDDARIKLKRLYPKIEMR